jgi:hypothetical protein
MERSSALRTVWFFVRQTKGSLSFRFFEGFGAVGQYARESAGIMLAESIWVNTGSIESVMLFGSGEVMTTVPRGMQCTRGRLEASDMSTLSNVIPTSKFSGLEPVMRTLSVR